MTPPPVLDLSKNDVNPNEKEVIVKHILVIIRALHQYINRQMKIIYQGVFSNMKRVQRIVPRILTRTLRMRNVKYQERYQTNSFSPVISIASCIRFSRSSSRRVAIEIIGKAMTIPRYGGSIPDNAYRSQLRPISTETRVSAK